MTLLGTPLTQADFANLKRSGIDRELAERAGLRRVDSFTGAEAMGRNGNRDYSGILFPYFLPGEGSPCEHRLRRDKPEMERTQDGTYKEQDKYLSPVGRRNRLYFVRDTPLEWLSDVSLPVVITEGEKKDLALWGLGWHGRSDAADRPRWLAVGISGVWNWRGTTGKVEGSNGERCDEVGPIPDLDLIGWRDRLVTIIFDANVRSNPSVRIARDMFAKELRDRGARVRFVDLPAGDGINGVDDLIGLKERDYVLSFIESNTYDPQAHAVLPAASKVTIEEIPSIFSFASKGVEFIVPGIIAAGAITLVTGESGAGKSTLVSKMAHCIANKLSFLGESCSQRDVLFLDRENSLSGVQDRFSRLRMQDGDKFRVWGGWLDVDPPDPGEPALLEWVARCDPRPVIIFDSLNPFLGGDENNAQEVRHFFDKLRRLANMGAAVIVFQNAGNGESAQEYRGSSDIKAAVDVAIKVTNFGGRVLGPLLIAPFKNRFAVTENFKVSFVNGEFVADQRPNAVHLTVTERLRELLRENPGILKKAFEDLAQRNGLTRDRARKFVNDGVVAKAIREQKGQHNSKSYYLVEREDREQGTLESE